MREKRDKKKDGVHRHDMSDGIWKILEPLLPGQQGQWGGVAEENRLFLNAVFWVLRAGAPWRDLPESYGKWKTVFQRFRRWRDKGVWEAILEKLVDEPEGGWIIIDANHAKVHPHGTGAVGGNQDMGSTKGGSTPRYIWPWARLVLRSEYLQRRVALLTAQRLLPS